MGDRSGLGGVSEAGVCGGSSSSSWTNRVCKRESEIEIERERERESTLYKLRLTYVTSEMLNNLMRCFILSVGCGE